MAYGSRHKETTRVMGDQYLYLQKNIIWEIDWDHKNPLKGIVGLILPIYIFTVDS